MSIAPELQRFFDEMAPMLRAQRGPADVERVLGASPSGTGALGFYAELCARNLRKILRDVFPCAALLVDREDRTRWPQMVTAFFADHPPCGHDPNAVAAEFPGWLSQHVEEARWSEVADFEWLRVLAHHAGDDSDACDGFERRLFVRQYSFDVPGFVAALQRDPAAALPDPVATIVLVFRHTRALRVCVQRPGLLGLAALARRQGLGVPPAFEALDPIAVAEAERVLIARGVLTPRPPSVIQRSEAS